jgi:hypothetical protein
MNQPLQYGDSSILVTYETQSTTISITVNAMPVPAPTTTTQLFHYNNNLINEVTQAASTGNVSYITGKFEQGISVSNNPTYYITLNWSHSNLIANDYTIEYWVKVSGGNNYVDTFLAQTGPSSGYSDYIFTSDNISSVGLKMNTSGSDSFASSCTVDTIPSNFNINSWNHIYITCTPNIFRTSEDPIRIIIPYIIFKA